MLQVLTCKCPQCGHEISTGYDIQPTDCAPENCANMPVSGSILVYNITTDRIQKYLNEKVQAIKPEGRIYVKWFYTEAHLREWESRHNRSESLLVVGFSPNIVQHAFEGLPVNMRVASDEPHLIGGLELEIVKPYQKERNAYFLDGKGFDGKHAEEKKIMCGMSESWARAAQRYCGGKLVPTDFDKATLFAVGLDPYKIICDMLADKHTRKKPGIITIDETRNEGSRLIYKVFMSPDGLINDADGNIPRLLEKVVGKYNK